MCFAPAHTGGWTCALSSVCRHDWCVCSQAVSLQCDTWNNLGLRWLSGRTNFHTHTSTMRF